MPDTKADYLVMLDLKTCTNEDAHDPEVVWGIPGSFSAWAREKSKTHRPVKCQGCGLFRVWEPRPAEWATP